jgi:hypothetical protein
LAPWFGALGPHTIHKEAEQSALFNLAVSLQFGNRNRRTTIFPSFGYCDGIPFYVNGNSLSFHHYFGPDRSQLAIYGHLTVEGVRKAWYLCTNSRCAQDH